MSKIRKDKDLELYESIQKEIRDLLHYYKKSLYKSCVCNEEFTQKYNDKKQDLLKILNKIKKRLKITFIVDYL